MYFRVTPFSITGNSIARNRDSLARLGVLQQQASSGLKYSRPSDNPLDTAKIQSLRRASLALEAESAQIGRAERQLNGSVSNLVDANTLLTRARQIAVEAPQSLGVSDRQALAAEVETLIERFVAAANAQDNGQYLYSGIADLTRPFEVNYDDSLAIPAVAYRGAVENASFLINDSISVDARYVGSDIFFSRDRGQSLYFGSTGAAAGSGTDSSVGRSDLAVKHIQTNYSGASGVGAGIDSVTGDTIIGQVGTHALTIVDTSGTGAFGTVSLNGGTTIDWTSADTNLAVSGPHGEVVHLDTTGISAGFNGNVDIEATGSLSIDGGVTETAIDFSNNQVVTNSLTGAVTNVNATGIVRSGISHIEHEGSADAITALFELRDDLLNERNLDEGSLSESFARRLEDLERASNQILKVVGEQSVSLQDLEQMQFRNGDLQLELATRISDLESVDLAEVIVEMQNVQNLMQFNFAALSIVQSNNLLDFLG